MSRSITTAALVATLTILGAATLTARPAEAQNLYGGFDVGITKYGYQKVLFDDGSSETYEDSATNYGLHFGFRPNGGTFGVEAGYAATSAESKTTDFPALVTGLNLLPANPVALLGTTTGANTGTLALGQIPTVDTEAESRTISIDAMGYFPVSGSFEAIGTLGLASTSFELKEKRRIKTSATDAAFVTGFDTTTTLKLDGIGLRLGLGGQFNFSDRFNVRGLVRYNKTGGDLKVVVKSTASLEVGVNLLF